MPVLLQSLAWFQHGDKVIDGFEQFETAISYLVGYQRIIQVDSMDKTLVYEIIKIFLYLAEAHVSGIHDFRLASAFFTCPEHIGDYFNVGTPAAYPGLPGLADLDMRI